VNYSKLLSLILLLTVFGTIWSSSFLALEANNSTYDRLSDQTSNQVLSNNNDNIKSHSISNRKTTLDAKETIEYVGPFPKQTIQQTIGDTKLFWVPDVSEPPYTYYQINATLEVNGPNCLIYSNISGITSTLSNMNDSFETIIFPKLTEFYGSPPDFNSDEKIILLVLDILDDIAPNYISGFFYAMNQYDNETHEYSNEAEILFIDGNEGLSLLSSGNFETVAHELQHLIHYGNDINEHLWLDEGASMFAEYLIGKDPFSIPTYKNPLQTNPDVSLTYWDYINADNLVLANYGASYAFFMYLAEHYGGSSFIQNVVTRSTDGIDSIEQSLAYFGYNSDFKELFRNWTIANYLDNTSFENGFYGYENVTISMSIEGSPYTNSAIPRTENEVPYWGTDYLFFDLPSDTPFNLEFKGDDQAGYIVTVILSNTSSTPLVMPVDISTIGYGNFSTEELGLTADEVTLVISSYTKGSTSNYNDTKTAPAQSYWFMINPSGVTISLGNLIFSGLENPLSIFNITVKDSTGHIWQEADDSTYEILNSSDMSTGISGNLTYNLDNHYWESSEINITSLSDGDYRIEYHFFNDTSSGIGYSETFTILTKNSTSTTTIGLLGIQISGFLVILTLLSLSSLLRKRNKN